MRLRATLFLVSVLLLFVMMQYPISAYADGGTWIKYPGNPVFGPAPNSWDADYTITPRVIFDGAIYRMWYVGGHGGMTDVGYANSTDGIVWRKYHTPVLSPGASGAWDSSKVGLGSVLWNGTLFLMWYQGSSPVAFPNGAIGLATSADGVSWVKYLGNPVLKPTDVDQKYIASPFVTKLNATYSMWYTAKSATDPYSSQVTRILYTTSFDGVKWFKWPTPVLLPSSNSAAWDSSSVFSPTIIYDGTNFGMWYSGLNQGLVGQVGFATSLDGATWTKSSSNPILSPGPPGSWDSAGVQQPSVAVGNGFMLYYDGYTPTTGRIGLARAPNGFTIPEIPTSTLTLLLGAVLSTAVCILSYQPKKKRAQPFTVFFQNYPGLSLT